MKSIAFFNNKGGVGKTTCTYAVGVALAKKGKKVLLVDADSQCNLTGYFYGLKDGESYENFLIDKNHHSVYSLTSEIFGKEKKDFSNGRKIYRKEFSSQKTPEKKSFFVDLLLGDTRIAEYEYDLALAVQTKTPALKKLPVVFYKNILEQYSQDYDYILFDMSPNYGVINLCLLMSCQYFIMPIFPDYFCYQSVSNMGEILVKWNENFSGSFRNINKNDDEDKIPFDLKPKFLGTITQNFKIYRQKAAKNFEKWQQKINEEIKNKMIPPLNDKNMAISENNFHSFFSDEKRSKVYNIENIRDYNTLGRVAELEGIPVSEIEEENLKNQEMFGHAIKQNMGTVRLFRDLFDYIAGGLEKVGL